MCLAKIKSGVALRTSSETEEGTGCLVNVQAEAAIAVETHWTFWVRDVS